MKSVEVTFNLSFTPDQFDKAKEYIDDMKAHPKRIFWLGKENQPDDELILSQIAHRILSGFYNNYDPAFAEKQIISMESREPGPGA